jgi:hypothetical protein
MPGPNFEVELTLYETTVKNAQIVIAEGPLGVGQTVKEICAWVVQRGAGKNDVAATEMATDSSVEFTSVPGKRWILALRQISTRPLEEGAAFAAGIALLAEPDGREKASIWAEVVYLKKATGELGDVAKKVAEMAKELERQAAP